MSGKSGGSEPGMGSARYGEDRPSVRREGVERVGTEGDDKPRGKEGDLTVEIRSTGMFGNSVEAVLGRVTFDQIEDAELRRGQPRPCDRRIQSLAGPAYEREARTILGGAGRLADEQDSWREVAAIDHDLGPRGVKGALLAGADLLRERFPSRSGRPSPRGAAASVERLRSTARAPFSSPHRGALDTYVK